MSFLNDYPDHYDLLLLGALEVIRNSTVAVVEESENSYVVAIVVVFNICGAIVIIIGVYWIRCVLVK